MRPLQNVVRRGAMVAGAAVCLAAAQSAPHPMPFVRVQHGPFVQMPSSTSATIVWRIWGRCEPEVHYGLSADALDQRAEAAAIRMLHSAGAEFDGTGGALITGPMMRSYKTPLSSTPGGTYQYEAALSGLQPGREYFYAVYHAGERIGGSGAVSAFRTLPDGDTAEKVTFLVTGGSGNGGLMQARVAAAARQYVEANALSPLHGMLRLGNIGSHWAWLERIIFEPYAHDLRRMAIWPVLAGDDRDNVFVDAFVLPAGAECGGRPSGRESWYAFDAGPMHVVCLDTREATFRDNALREDMLAWLGADLAANRAGGRNAWRVAACGQWPHEGEERTRLAGLLAANDVALVLTGDPGYCRTRTLDAPDAPVLISAGISGALAGPGVDTGVARIQCPDTQGSLVVEAAAESIRITLVDADGRVADTTVIEPAAKEAAAARARKGAPQAE